MCGTRAGHPAAAALLGRAHKSVGGCKSYQEKCIGCDIDKTMGHGLPIDHLLLLWLEVFVNPKKFGEMIKSFIVIMNRCVPRA